MHHLNNNNSYLIHPENTINYQKKRGNFSIKKEWTKKRNKNPQTQVSRVFSLAKGEVFEIHWFISLARNLGAMKMGITVMLKDSHCMYKQAAGSQQIISILLLVRLFICPWLGLDKGTKSFLSFRGGRVSCTGILKAHIENPWSNMKAIIQPLNGNF